MHEKNMVEIQHLCESAWAGGWPEFILPDPSQWAIKTNNRVLAQMKNLATTPYQL